jgi:hypothetical protein
MAGVGEVSAIVSLATFGVAVAKNIILYSRKVKGAPNELEAIADEVHSASRLL